MIKGLVGSCKGFRLHWKGDWKPVKSSEEKSDILRIVLKLCVQNEGKVEG